MTLLLHICIIRDSNDLIIRSQNTARCSRHVVLMVFLIIQANYMTNIGGAVGRSTYNWILAKGIQSLASEWWTYVTLSS